MAPDAGPRAGVFSAWKDIAGLSDPDILGTAPFAFATWLILNDLKDAALANTK